MGNEKEKKEYDLAVNERAKKFRSQKLVSEGEKIKKALQDKNSDMQSLIVNGGFLSGIRVAFKKWSFNRYKKKAMTKLSQIEAELKVVREVEQKQEERESNLEKYNEELKNEDFLKSEQEKDKVSNGDLQYHTYSGKGLKAKNNSEILALLNNEKELKGFKLDVYNQVKSELDERETELGKKYDDNEKLLSDIVKINKENGKEFTKETLLDALKKRDEHDKLKEDLERAEETSKLDKERLEGIAKERKALKARLEKMTSEYNPIEDSSDILKGEEYYKKIAPEFKKLEQEYLSYKTRRDAHDILSGPEISRMMELKAQYEPQKKVHDDLLSAIKSKKQRVDSFNTDKEEIINQLNSLDEEEKDINDSLKERQALISDGEKKLSELSELSFRGKKNIDGYDDLLRYDANNKLLKKQIDQVKSSKENLESEILHTDISSVMLDNYGNDKVHGIAIAGKLYLDDKQIQGLDLNDAPKVSDAEKKRVIETQKIVRALKNRPIFRIMNSNTISEYMTYDEKKGTFDLHDDNSGEKLEDYEARIRKKYFSDDNIFHQHLIESDPTSYRKGLSKELAKEAFGFALTKSLSFLKNNGPEMLAKKIGNEELKTAVSVGRKLYNFEKSSSNYVKKEGRDERTEKFDQIKLAEDGIKTCLGVLEKVVKPNNIANPLADTMADFALAKGLSGTLLNNKGFGINGFNIAAHIIDMTKAATTIAQASMNESSQKKKAEEVLRRGHERFARFMKEAVSKTQFDRTEAIIDLSTKLAKDGFMIATGLGGMAVDACASVAKAGVSALHSYVAGKQNDNELLNSPAILGGIDYDKNVISDDDFNGILQSVTGIQDKASLAESMRVIDAIDMHRAAKNLKKNPNSEVVGIMKEIGFNKPSSFDKIKVNDILKKTSIKSGNFLTRLRNSVEQKGLHYSSTFSRWFKSLFKKKGLSGKAAVTREELAHKKQKENLEATDTVEGLQQKEGGKLLYDSYIARLKVQSTTMPINEIKTVHTPNYSGGQINREIMLAVFSNIPEANKAFECKNNPLSKQKVEDLLDDAIDHANELIKNSIEAAKQTAPQQQEKQTNKAVQQGNQWVL